MVLRAAKLDSSVARSGHYSKLWMVKALSSADNSAVGRPDGCTEDSTAAAVSLCRFPGD